MLKLNNFEVDKDVAVLQIGNSGARMAAISEGLVDGTIVVVDFQPKAKKDGFNILADSGGFGIRSKSRKKSSARIPGLMDSERQTGITSKR
jgi:hypothetical protein